ncbi:MAG: DUF5715 family protein [Gemmatimonadota bacterium]
MQHSGLPAHGMRAPAGRCLGASVLGALVMLGTLLAAPPAISGQSLRGSPASLDIQNRVARENDYSYIDTAERVRYFVEQGWLVRVQSKHDFALHAVSFPYARPEVALFVERLAQQYRAACGEQLVVTSLTRPTTRQPRNASARSVHPTGMAIDLRYSRDQRCRNWLEGVLLSLERAGVLDATLERYPLHYHVALFPSRYAAYVENLVTRSTTQMAGGEAYSERSAYTIQAGDSLWEIARQHGVSVDELQAVNRIDGNRIYAGQVIDVPLGG